MQFFFPLVVKVLDANGAPIPNKVVNWSLVSTFGGPFPNFLTQTVTDGTGTTSTFFQQAFQPGSVALRYLQSVVQASADGVSVNFTETQALADTVSKLRGIFVRLDSPAIGATLTGTAGAPGTVPIKVHVDAFGPGVPGVSVRMLNTNNPGTGATASCATGANADPGAVLTDANGDATCTVVFGSVAGTGSFTVLVGGVDPLQSPLIVVDPTIQAIGYAEPGGVLGLNVKVGVPGQILTFSGDGQTVNPGQASQPLVVKVTDASGVNPIAGQTVNWTVTPAGAATLSPTASTSDATGQASTVARLPSTAAGVITVKGTVAGSTALVATFTIRANVQVTGLQKVSGDTQTVPAGQSFPSPLVVQVNASTGQPAPGLGVNFAISGPGTLSATSATTDANGRAQVTVTAGASAGTVTVTATAGAFSQAFTLTVVPPGPLLSTGSILNGADFQRNSISPCSVATIQAIGLAPTLQGIAVPGTLIGPLPFTLAGDQVTVNNSQAPIYSVSNIRGQEQLTFQVPCDVTPGNNIPLTVNVSGGTATVNITVLAASPGIFGTVMSDGVSRAVMVRPDGSFVSLQNPARRGEIIRLYATGLGALSPPVGTNSIAVPGTDSLVTGQLIVGVNNAGARVISARLAPTLIGVYEVTFQVPTDAPVGNDVVLSLAINATGDAITRFSAGNKIPIQ